MGKTTLPPDIMPRKELAQFDFILESSRVARTEVHRAIIEQNSLIDKLFKSQEQKAAARGLIVATAKAAKVLITSSERAELQFWRHASALANDQLMAIRDGHKREQSLAHMHETELSLLRADLHSAELEGEYACRCIQERWAASLELERAAKDRVVATAAAAAEGHAKTVRELEKAMATQRNELHASVDAASVQLQVLENELRRALAGAEAACRAYQEQVDELTQENEELAASLHEQTWRADNASQMLEELRQMHQAVLLEAETLKQQLAQKDQDTALAQAEVEAMVAAKMASMQRMQAWTLASGAARALESRASRDLLREESLLRRSVGELDHQLVVQSHEPAFNQFPRLDAGTHYQLGINSSVSPRLMPSAQSASRSRGLLYSQFRELARSTSEGQLTGVVLPRQVSKSRLARQGIGYVSVDPFGRPIPGCT